MAIFTFETEELRIRESTRVKELFAAIRTEPVRDVWIQVKNRKASDKYDGWYKNIKLHGAKRKEWEFLHTHPHIKHIIILSIGDSSTKYSVANLIAHEYAHLLQYHNGQRRKMHKTKRAREHHANRWAIYRLKQLNIN